MEKRGVVSRSYESKIFSKSQVSTEFMIILAFVLLLIGSLIAVNQGLMTKVGNQFRVSKARLIVDDLAETAEYVYSQGQGAQTKVLVSVPEGVVTTQVSNRTIVMSVISGSQSTRDVYRNLDFPVRGSIPAYQGNHWITLRSQQGYVEIGYNVISVDSTGLSSTLLPGNSTSGQISITNEQNSDLDVLLSYVGDEGINVSLSQTTLTIASNQTVDIDVDIITQSPIDSGTYSGRVQIVSNTTSETATNSLSTVVTVPQVQQCTTCPSLILYPGSWSIGDINTGQSTYKLYHICNNLEVARSVDLSFSNTSYVGFNSGITSKTASFSVSPNQCNITFVYLNATGSNSETYSTTLEAESSPYSSESDISANIIFTGALPQINLISPAHNYNSSLDYALFVYNVTDADSSIASCSLIINNQTNQTNNTITESQTQTFTLTNLAQSQYHWTINCTDDSPSSIENSAQTRTLIVSNPPSTFYITPELAFEEDYDPSWTSQVQTLNDGSYATSVDEGPPSYPPADYTEFDFPSLGLSENWVIDSVIFTVSHYEDLGGGALVEDDRHQIQCYNGVDWQAINTWNSSLAWDNYTSPDLSTCINTYDLANDIHIRMTFDPSVQTGPEQYIDFAQVEVNVSPAFFVNLWDLALDSPLPVDFSSGLNTSENTFGIDADDGWDWQENPYGSGLNAVEFNIDPDMDSNIGDSTVGSDNRIQVKLGGGAPGAPASPDDGSTTGFLTSGAYGIQFEITPEYYNAIQNGGSVMLTFDWIADDDADYGDSLSVGEEAWIKARLTTPSTTVWLGSDLDASDDDADANNEIWFMDDPIDDSGSETINLTSSITQMGDYYIDLGAAIGGWSASTEGFGAYFDNVLITITG
ncbi:MAG: hypothetical protein MAG795_00622 [Candidatus Woesearchaeota archaeon]|nr:hypothetical protein [Candidatus Woesearchaeota archaeon]